MSAERPVVALAVLVGLGPCAFLAVFAGTYAGLSLWGW